MTRRPLLLLTAILLALLVAAWFVRWPVVGALRELSQVSTPIGAGPALPLTLTSASDAVPTPASSAANRDFARPSLASTATVGRAQTSPSASASAALARRSVATQGPVVVGKAATGPSANLPTAAQWAKLRDCESGYLGYRANTGNGYYGAYQFDLETWHGIDEIGRPDLASPSTQDAAARKLYALRGAEPWPVCGRWLR